MQTRIKFEKTGKRDRVLDSASEKQPNAFSKVIFSALKEKNHSKDSKGLWARRKEKRFQVLARYRNLCEPGKNLKDQRLETVHQPVLSIKKLIRSSPTDQPSVPNRYPTGVWELRKHSWTTKFAHIGRNNSKMAKTNVQNTGNQDKEKKVKDVSGKKKSQTDSLRRHPKFQNVKTRTETEGSGDGPRRYYQPRRQQNTCCHCHSVLDTRKKAKDPGQQRHWRGNVKNPFHHRCQVPSKRQNQGHQTSVVQTKKRIGARDERHVKRRSFRKNNPQQKYKKQKKLDCFPASSYKKVNNRREKSDVQIQKRRWTRNRNNAHKKMEKISEGLARSFSQILLL